jgi:hypothetical protein
MEGTPLSTSQSHQMTGLLTATKVNWFEKITAGFSPSAEYH